MQRETRLAVDSFMARIAELNGVSDASKQFAAVPSVQQTLETHIQESSAFLQNVNFVGVNDQQGEKVGLSTTSTIAGRTDTSGAGERTPVDPTDSDARGYFCKQTDFDTALTYAKLDAWAKFKDFQVRIRNMIVRQQALDRIMVGFNGASAAATTDRVTNPLLQDVNIGWLKKLETEAAARYMTEGGTAGQIRVGAGNVTAGYGDYANLDALVHDMRSNLLGAWHARNSNFKAICSSDLTDEKYFPLIEAHGGTPTESNALDLMLSAKRLGGLQAAEVPFFPTRSIFLSLLDKNESNLSLYYQEGKRRRHIEDNPKKNQLENYESSNDAYVIEDLTGACAAVNIMLWDPVTEAWY